MKYAIVLIGFVVFHQTKPFHNRLLKLGNMVKAIDSEIFPHFNINSSDLLKGENGTIFQQIQYIYNIMENIKTLYKNTFDIDKRKILKEFAYRFDSKVKHIIKESYFNDVELRQHFNLSVVKFWDYHLMMKNTSKIFDYIINVRDIWENFTLSYNISSY